MHNPSAEVCSTLTQRVVYPSQIYFQNGLTLLGHIFRYLQSLEYHSTFMPFGQYSYTRGPSRVGRPSLHGAESTMAEALQRIPRIDFDSPPSHYCMISIALFSPSPTPPQ